METIILTFEDGSKKEYMKGVKLGDVVKDLDGKYSTDVICAICENKIKGLNDVISESSNIILFDFFR